MAQTIVHTQLATRIPKELHKRMKRHCLEEECHMADFIIEAITEKLGKGKKKS